MTDETTNNEDQADLVTGETTALPKGFNVLRAADNELLGTYLTQADAEAFISSQLAPQSIEASIVEGF